MTGWHADEITLRRWIDQSDSLPEGASVEQHLLSCAPCRARVSTLVSPGPAASPLASPVAGQVRLIDTERSAVRSGRASTRSAHSLHTTSMHDSQRSQEN